MPLRDPVTGRPIPGTTGPRGVGAGPEPAKPTDTAPADTL